MAFRDFVIASSKCIGILIGWNLTFLLLPSIFYNKKGIMYELLTFNGDDVGREVLCGINGLFIVGLTYMCVDYYNELKGQFHLKRNVYPNRKISTKIDWDQYNKAIHLSFMNTFTTLFTVVFILNPLRKLIGTNVADSNLPWIFLKVPFLFILSDIIFHVTHYQLHRIHWLYEHVHKIHHQFVDTFALCATACHTLEHIIVNLSAVTLPTIILNIPFRCSYYLGNV
eukprot:95878_1